MAAMAAMPGWSSLRHPDTRRNCQELLPQDGILPVARPRNTSFESKQGPKRSRKWVGGSRGPGWLMWQKLWKKHVCNWDESAAWEVLVSACLSLSSAPVACGGFMMASKEKTKPNTNLMPSKYRKVMNSKSPEEQRNSFRYFTGTLDPAVPKLDILNFEEHHDSAESLWQFRARSSLLRQHLPVISLYGGTLKKESTPNSGNIW